MNQNNLPGVVIASIFSITLKTHLFSVQLFRNFPLLNICNDHMYFLSESLAVCPPPVIFSEHIFSSSNPYACCLRFFRTLTGQRNTRFPANQKRLDPVNRCRLLMWLTQCTCLISKLRAYSSALTCPDVCWQSTSRLTTSCCFLLAFSSNLNSAHGGVCLFKGGS